MKNKNPISIVAAAEFIETFLDKLNELDGEQLVFWLVSREGRSEIQILYTALNPRLIVLSLVKTLAMPVICIIIATKDIISALVLFIVGFLLLTKYEKNLKIKKIIEELPEKDNIISFPVSGK